MIHNGWFVAFDHLFIILNQLFLTSIIHTHGLILIETIIIMLLNYLVESISNILALLNIQCVAHSFCNIFYFLSQISIDSLLGLWEENSISVFADEWLSL